MLDIQAAKQWCEAATDGPWEADEDEKTHAMVVYQPESGSPVVYDGECLSDADAEFIAHAREDLPAALEALEEAQGKLAAVLQERNAAESEGATLVTQLLKYLHCEARPDDEAAIKAEGRDMLGCEDDTAIESWCMPCQIRAKWR